MGGMPEFKTPKVIRKSLPCFAVSPSPIEGWVGNLFKICFQKRGPRDMNLFGDL